MGIICLFLAEEIMAKTRHSGVLMHISSLFGDYSIGSFGKEAKYFIDFLADCKFTYWQVLPFCMVDECNSPYKSYSAFGGNPYFIDLPTLFEKGLLTQDELNQNRQETPYSAEFTKLYHTRFNLLQKAAERVKDRKKIEDFIESDPYLLDFCKFMALKKANDEKPWIEWKNENYDPEILFLWKFIQYEFANQWDEILKYAHSKGIKLIGDVPIYVDFDSCDVWSNKDLFLLDENYKPKVVAGCPPDYFAKDGQLWGNPIYDWEKMEKDNFKWWSDRLQHLFKMFDGVRIDHFRGISSYWSVPASAKTAREGKWVDGPGKKFVDMVNKIKGDHMIIAEDLGEITPDVIDLMEYSNFPGMRVLQFGFLGDYDNPHLPHNYCQNCIAYSGTHDNNTLLGYIWEQTPQDREHTFKYCGYFGEDWGQGYDAIVRTLFQSHAGTVILPIQDILKYGADTRLNIPGKADGNWSYRITKDQLDSIDKSFYRNLNNLYKR
jgi:4-alpha-glucanotransferase